jgi:hypothetical protein
MASVPDFPGSPSELDFCLSVSLSAELIDAQECSKIAQESFDCLSILVMLKNCSVNPLLGSRSHR